jgi:hypothetical protein
MDDAELLHFSHPLCAQMGNKYAYAFLLKHDWVLCAPNMVPLRSRALLFSRHRGERELRIKERMRIESAQERMRIEGADAD